MAIYNGVILDVHFPMVVYSKILSQEKSLISEVQEINIHNLSGIDETLANSLKEILTYNGDVEEDLDLTFEVFKVTCGQY